MATLEPLHRSFPAVPVSVVSARDAIVSFAARAGADRDCLDSIRLAVSEALTNAVVHGYAGEPGAVDVTAAVAGGELWVLIADEGQGLQVRASSGGLGMGLALIALASHSFTLMRRSCGGIEVRLCFQLEAANSARGDYARGSQATGSRPESSRRATIA